MDQESKKSGDTTYSRLLGKLFIVASLLALISLTKIYGVEGLKQFSYSGIFNVAEHTKANIGLNGDFQVTQGSTHKEEQVITNDKPFVTLPPSVETVASVLKEDKNINIIEVSASPAPTLYPVISADSIANYEKLIFNPLAYMEKLMESRFSCTGEYSQLNRDKAFCNGAQAPNPTPGVFILGSGPTPSNTGTLGGDGVFNQVNLGATTINPSGINSLSGFSINASPVTISNLTAAGPATFNDVIKVGPLSSDPSSAVNGATYYNTTSNTFRCFTNGAWANCGSGSGSLASNSIDWDEIIASMTLDTNTDVALNGKILDIGSGLFLINGVNNSISLNADIFSITRASISSNLEVSGLASFSSIFVGGQTIRSVTSNSLDFDEFVASMTLDTNTDISLNSKILDISNGGLFISTTGITSNLSHIISGQELAVGSALNVGSIATVAYSRFGTATTTHSNFISTESDLLLSGDLEVDGSATFDGLNGSVLAIAGGFNIASVSLGGTLKLFNRAGDPTGVNGLMYYDTGANKFRCYEASGWKNCIGSVGGGGFLQVREGYSGGFTSTSSVSFKAGDFNLNFNGTQSSISLDWTNGPASRSIAQTITGLWTFSNGASVSNTLEVAGLASIGTLRVGGQLVKSVTSNSIDWDEIINGMTLDANTTIALGANTLNFGTGAFVIGAGGLTSNVSTVISGQELAVGSALNVGSIATVAYSRFGTNTTTHANFISTASDLLLSGDLEVDGSATFDGLNGSVLTIAGGFNIASVSLGGTLKLFNRSGDPTGVNGLTYYDTGTNKFRCYQASAWTDCIGSGSSRPASNSLDWDEITNAMILDTTTSIRMNSNDLNFGSGLLYLDAPASRVGIGTQTPTNTLSVNGTASISGNTTLRGVTYSWPTATGGTGNFLRNDGAGNLTWASSSGNGSGSGALFDTVFYDDWSDSYSEATTTASGSTNDYIIPANTLRNGSGIRIYFTYDVTTGGVAVPTVANMSVSITASGSFFSGGTKSTTSTGLMSNTVNRDGVAAGTSGNTGYIDLEYTSSQSAVFSTLDGISSFNTSPEQFATTSYGTLNANYNHPIRLRVAITTNYTGGAASSNATFRNLGVRFELKGTTSSSLSGSGSANQVAYWNGGSSLTGASNFTWNNGTSTLDINGDVIAQNVLQAGGTTPTSYSRLGGKVTTHGNYISNSADLLISGDLEVRGSLSAEVASASMLLAGLRLSTNGFALCHENNGAQSSGEEIKDCGSAPTADYMEMYPVSETADEAGIIVMPSTEEYAITNKGDKVSKLIPSNKEYNDSMLGIVSVASEAGDFNSIGYNIKQEDNPTPIALNGRVKVKVSNKNGIIKPGDYITSSDIQGTGMKATKSGRVVGMALESSQETSDPNEIQKVMVFVNTNYRTVGSIQYSVDSTQSTSIEGGALVSLFKNIIGLIKDMYGLTIESGFIKVANIIGNIVSADFLETKNGITTYDTNTKKAYCVQITDGNLVAKEGNCSDLMNPDNAIPAISPTPSATPEVTIEIPEPVISPEPEPQITPENSPEPIPEVFSEVIPESEATVEPPTPQESPTPTP